MYNRARIHIHTHTKKWHGTEWNWTKQASEFNGMAYYISAASRRASQINNNAIWNRKIYPKGTVYVCERMHSIFTRTHAQSAINVATISTALTQSESKKERQRETRKVFNKSPSHRILLQQNNFRHWFSFSIFLSHTSHFVLPSFSWCKHFYTKRAIVPGCVYA